MEKNVEVLDEEIEETGFHILDYLIILAKHKKLILSITLPFALIAFLFTLPKDSFYQAEISILPLQQQQTKLVNQFIGIIPRESRNILTSTGFLVEIIKSREFSERIIKRFNLASSDNMEDARTNLWNNLTIVPDPTQYQSSFGGTSPLIRIFARDQNAQRAADIANGIVEELASFVNNIAISDASRRKLFFEKQLKTSFAKLNKAEEDIKAFKEKNGILVVEGKTSIAANKFAPTLEMEYKRLSRQLGFHEVLYEILIKQYESAKIDESKDAYIIQVIDGAIPPIETSSSRKFGRKKALAVTLLVFLFSCLSAFVREFSEVSVQNKKIETLKSYLSFKKVP